MEMVVESLVEADDELNRVRAAAAAAGSAVLAPVQVQVEAMM